MTAPLNFARAKHLAARFVRSDSGSIAPLFGFMLVGLLSLMGAAVDFARFNNARTAMQGALDAAALMISKDAAVANPPMSDADLKTKSWNYFKTLYTNAYAPADFASFSATYTKTTGAAPSIVLYSKGSMPTELLKLANVTKMDFSANSTATWGTTRLRIALALDNTGSMASANKMTNLKSAAKDLIDKLAAKASTQDDLYISIVPFAKDINVGSSFYTATWIDWTDWEAEPPILDPARGGAKPSNWSDIGPGSTCPFDRLSTWSAKFGFTCMDRVGSDSSANAVESVSPYSFKVPASGFICPGLDNGEVVSTKWRVYYNGCYTSTLKASGVISTGSSASCTGYSNCSCSGNVGNSGRKCTATNYYEHVWRPTTPANSPATPPHSTWNGCIADRTQDKDTTAVAPSSADVTTQFPAEQYADCPTQLVPLTSVTTSNGGANTLKTNTIDKMQPAGNTNQPIGLAWAWLSLLNQAPMNGQPQDPNYQYKRAIILLSDGDNTQNRTSSDKSTIDARQRLLCKNAQADAGVYTIQVNTDGSATSSVMSDCASPAPNGKFYPTSTGGGIATAFDDIYNSLSKLRIAQ